MPAPRKGEKRAAYVERCVPVVIKDGAAKKPAQAVAICESMFKTAARSLAFTASADAKPYWDVIDGKRHVVVPTIALLGDIVVRPMNSEVAEFVPGSALAANAGDWDGMPIVWHHPEDGRALVADSPEIQAKYAFGHMRATRYANGALQTEACMDPERAALIGADAADRVKRCADGEGLVDVSIGAMIDFEQLAGTHGGRDYGITWRAVRPDHLAILPSGLPGACSVAAGCGAPRVMAERNLCPAEKCGNLAGMKTNHPGIGLCWSHGGAAALQGKKGTPMPNKLDKILRALGLRADDAAPEVDESLVTALAAADAEYNGVVEFGGDRVIYMSGERLLSRGVREGVIDTEPVEVEPVTRYEPLASSALDVNDLSNQQLTTLLVDALGDEVERLGWVQDVFPASRRVIYTVQPPPGSAGSSQSYQRTYTFDAAGNIALGGDVTPVEQVTTWEALAALVGKRHSASDQKMVQTVHDHAVALGAECKTSTPSGYAGRRGFLTLAEINRQKGGARSSERRIQGE